MIQTDNKTISIECPHGPHCDLASHVRRDCQNASGRQRRREQGRREWRAARLAAARCHRQAESLAAGGMGARSMKLGAVIAALLLAGAPVVSLSNHANAD